MCVIMFISCMLIMFVHTQPNAIYHPKHSATSPENAKFFDKIIIRHISSIHLITAYHSDS